MAGYTVIDVETTGLSPAHHDRIVELGVVYVSHEGQIQDHWSTLINPSRDVGPTRIHGISASDARDAPTFAEVAPYVLKAMSGRITVAHNASFDLRFLASELNRAGVPLSDQPLVGLCTMKWASAYLQTSSRRLADCCRACGVQLTEAHSAHADALATAQMLTYFLNASAWRPPWQDTLDLSRAYHWPNYVGEYPELRMSRRGAAPEVRQDQWLDAIVSRMPRAADPAVDSYLATLELALLDGFLAEHEKDQLVRAALESGLSRGQVLDLHADYLRAMAEVALADEVITPTERDELQRFAAILGLRATDVDTAILLASQSHNANSSGSGSLSWEQSATTRLSTSGIELNPGDRVVFTGEMKVDRSEWDRRSRIVGLVPGGVTKQTKIVVAADPNSLSGKAAKARAYGIPIVTEAAFAGMLSALMQ